MSAKRSYDHSAEETLPGSAWHSDKRQRADGSLERMSEQENEEGQTENSGKTFEDFDGDVKSAPGSFLDCIDRELLERVAAAHEPGSESENPEDSSLEKSDYETEELTDSDDDSVGFRSSLDAESEFDNSCREETDAGGITTPLCTFCRGIFDNWNKVVNCKDSQSPVDFPHCRDPFAMEQSAADGCSLCTQFLQDDRRDDSYTRRERRHDLQEYEKKIGDTMKFPCGIVQVKSGQYKGKYDRKTTFWYLRLLFEHPKGFWDVARSYRPQSLLPRESYGVNMASDGAPSYTLRSDKRSKSSSEDSLPLAKKWFESCCNSHKQCNNRKRLFRPTRLVYIGDDVPRLHIWSDFEDGVIYATLSHCWGTTSLPTLETKDLPQFRTEIPSKALSKTFKDAIRIGKLLDIQYLWIDSLCIFQDDSDDWRRESSQMYHVYSNSIMNIAASGASDGTQGCFFERSQAWICQIVGLYGQEKVIYKCTAPEKFARDMNTPLESRGWTFQERYLAPRTLHFTANEVYWECYHTNACETFPAGMQQKLVESLGGLKKIFTTPISAAVWNTLVQAYSTRKLTFSSDKLVALSGIAQAIHLQSNDEYVVGMWRSKLEIQLCWKLSYDGQIKNREEIVPYRAPTWSWASVDGAIDFKPRRWGGLKMMVNIKVLEVDIIRPGADLFGAICFAKLLISCIVVVHGEIVFGKSNIGSTVYWLEVEGSRIYHFYPNFDRSDLYEGAISSVYMLPVLGWGGLEDIHGLLLNPTGQARGEYQRTGFFTFKAPEARKFEELSMEQMRRTEDRFYSCGELYTTKSRIVTLI